MKRIVSVLAVSMLAVACAGKSADSAAGSETAAKEVGGVTIGAVFSISTEPLRKTVQEAVGQSQVVYVGDQLEYLGLLMPV